MLYVDLDGFKAVNDRHGHAYGDAVLVEAARRLRRTVREADTVAKLSGDEFAVVQAADAQPEAALALCRRILQAVMRAAHGSVAKRSRSVPSIGVALGPADADDPASLLRLADKALYRAKRSGRGTFRVFDRRRESLRAGATLPSRAVGQNAQ